ncbi:hypothetical protein SAMN02745148_01788 [Modicisalibacter ilicicola DSM 19980]|uniref:Molecular chaperone DnaJ n=1 Tax=Modicisalibacter ilicicola DSM 19980 TaxID=1121942 RepID=A0A1M4YY08_9GAMM|nr:hypothetical protein SAMN02745148_01788 [Halomonas ilicicola DSM 19980]
MACSYCNGEGEVRCPVCKGGVVEIECPDCDGDGWIVDPEAEKLRECNRCEGEGTLTPDECSNCDGMGLVDCDDCNGTGEE